MTVSFCVFLFNIHVTKGSINIAYSLICSIKVYMIATHVRTYIIEEIYILGPGGFLLNCKAPLQIQSFFWAFDLCAAFLRHCLLYLLVEYPFSSECFPKVIFFFSVFTPLFRKEHYTLSIKSLNVEQLNTGEWTEGGGG